MRHPRSGLPTGSLTRRPNGYWYLTLHPRDPATGTYRTKTLALGTQDERQARERATALVADYLRGQPLPSADARTPLGDWLTEWLRDKEAQGRSGATIAQYRSIIRSRLVPGLGGVRLGQLTPDHIRRYLRKEAESPRQNAGRKGGDGRGTISSRTVALEHAILRQALEAAVRLDILPRNPADRVDPPRVVNRPAHRLSPDEVGRLLRATHGHRLHALWVLLFATGLRIGEALRLSWDDVDLEAGTVHVRRSKTAAGVRTVPISREVTDALRAHRAAQLRERLAAGPLWGDGNLVFATRRGTPLSVGNVRRRDWRLALEAAGLPPYRLHDARHTAGSMILEEAAESKAGLRAAQDMLGHASASFMLARYAHSLPAAQREVAERIGRRLRDG